MVANVLVPVLVSSQIQPPTHPDSKYLITEDKAYIVQRPQLAIPGKIISYSVSPSGKTIVATVSEISMETGLPTMTESGEPRPTQVLIYRVDDQRLIEGPKLPETLYVNITQNWDYLGDEALFARFSDSSQEKRVTRNALISLTDGSVHLLQIPDNHIVSNSKTNFSKARLAVTVQEMDPDIDGFLQSSLILYNAQGAVLNHVGLPNDVVPGLITIPGQDSPFLIATDSRQNFLFDLSTGKIKEVSERPSVETPLTTLWYYTIFASTSTKPTRRIPGLYLSRNPVERTEETPMLYLASDASYPMIAESSAAVTYVTELGVIVRQTNETSLTQANQMYEKELLSYMKWIGNRLMMAKMDWEGRTRQTLDPQTWQSQIMESSAVTTFGLTIPPNTTYLGSLPEGDSRYDQVFVIEHERGTFVVKRNMSTEWTPK